MTMDVEAEIRDLKRRVGELEGSFGFLAQQIKGVHKDLLAFQQQTERDIRDVKNDVHDVKNDVGEVKNDVRKLRADLPEMLAEAVRVGMRERPSR